MKHTKTRRSVFETNSSSTHSISIASGAETLDTLPMENGVVAIEGGEFGWEVNDYYDACSKASYCMTWAFQYGTEEHREMLKRVIQQRTGADKVVLRQGDDSYYPNGYIDHQSDDVCKEAFKSEKSLRDFIFDPRSWFHTCNDNGGCSRCDEEYEKKYGNN